MTHDPRDHENAACPGCQGQGFIPDDYYEPERFYRCDDCGGTGTFRAVA